MSNPAPAAFRYYSSSSSPSSSSSSSSSGSGSFPTVVITVVGILAAFALLASYYAFVTRCQLLRSVLSRNPLWHAHSQEPSTVIRSGVAAGEADRRELGLPLIRMLPVVKFTSPVAGAEDAKRVSVSRMADAKRMAFHGHMSSHDMAMLPPAAAVAAGGATEGGAPPSWMWYGDGSFLHLQTTSDSSASPAAAAAAAAAGVQQWMGAGGEDAVVMMMGGGGGGMVEEAARCKAEVLSHPLYEQLLSAHVSCLRIAPRRIEESAWVVDVERAMNHGDPSAEVAQWRWHSIYRVLACIQDLNRKAYQPQVVSLGPFHHGEPHLLPMDGHKRRSLRHFLRRARKPLSDFAAAMAGVAEQLEGAHQGLDEEWRSGGGEAEEIRVERFLELMVTDGCFLLEVMRTATGWGVNDYAPNDPVFSSHSLLYTVPYIRRDMLMIENQLPLLVLDKLVTVESGKDGNEDLINRMVLRFLSPAAWPLTTGVGLAHHPLDIIRRSLLYGPIQAPRRPPDSPPDDIILSAEELYEAGIRFKRSQTSSLLDISFRRGVLYLPAIVVDDTTEYMLLNLMAFKRLHAGAGNEVTAYVFFMDNMIDSAADVALLSSRRIVYNTVGSDKAVANLFNGMSRDVVLEPHSTLDDVHRQVNAYCWKRWNRWRANLVHTYFKSPWSFLSIAAAVFLLGMTILQTIYTVLPFYQDANS